MAASRLAIAIAAASLAACAGEQSDVYEYTCTLVRTCDGVRHATELPLVGTFDDAKAFAHDWSTGCQTLTEPDVREQRCEVVICYARCEDANGEELADVE